MIRMTKLTDYASVLMTYFAKDPARPHNARDLASETHLPLPTVSKVLKSLARGGLLESHRGLNGGYALSRDASEISLADILTAMEGPMFRSIVPRARSGTSTARPRALWRTNSVHRPIFPRPPITTATV